MAINTANGEHKLSTLAAELSALQSRLEALELRMTAILNQPSPICDVPDAELEPFLCKAKSAAYWAALEARADHLRAAEEADSELLLNQG